MEDVEYNKDYKNDVVEYFAKLKDTIDSISLDDINTLMNVLEGSKDDDRTIFIMGNGGSAATASHYVCDFNKGLTQENQKRYKFFSLNDNIPSMMAYANDVSYEDIFVEQLKNHFKEGDVVFGISGSGNSMNVIKAVEYANNHGGTTIALTGYSGGKLGSIAKHNVNVPVDDMQIAEDMHMIIDHCMMRVLY